MSEADRASVSRARLAVLVAGPVVVFVVLALVVLMAVGVVAFFSAMGHGSLTSEEALPMWIVGGVVALTGTTAVVLLLERWTFGRSSERTDAMRAMRWRTRAGSIALAVVIAGGGPPLAGEVSLQAKLARIRGRGDAQERYSTIWSFTVRPSPRAFATLRECGGEYRRRSAHARRGHLRARAVSGGAGDAARAGRRWHGRGAGGGGSRAARCRRGRRRVGGDRSPRARGRDAARPRTHGGRAGGGSVHPSRSDQRARLLRELARGDTPGVALQAARGLGTGGYDAALAILMDSRQLDDTRRDAIRTLGELKNPRAVPVLQKIVTGDFEAGFIAPDDEDDYRRDAHEAIARLRPPDVEQDEGWSAYGYEQATLIEVGRVLRAQLAYRSATGFLDARLGCVELPATCIPGRDPDESFLGPSLVSLLPRRGYLRRFHPGPAVPREQIEAKGGSPTSVVSFAYVAVPEVPLETGLRAFCADDTGRICFTRAGRAPRVADGRCPESATEPREYREGLEYYAAPPRECGVSR